MIATPEVTVRVTQLVWALVLTIVPAFLALGCDCAGPGSGAVCAADPPPPACGAECDAATACPAGYYCQGTMCTADCDSFTPCPTGQRCDPTGHCVSEDSDGGRRDSGPRRDSGEVDANCASVDFNATGTIPTVILIVDRSFSMDTDFEGSTSRWDVLRRELLAADGLIATLEANVRFGLVLYTAPSTGTCPDLVTVPAVLNNYAAIMAEYEMWDVGLYTPTGDAISEVVARIDELAPDRENTIFVLATDGEPNSCEMRDTTEEAFTYGKGESLAAVQAAYAAGVQTYVISVGDDIDDLNHLTQIAMAGSGNAPGSDYYPATDTSGLSAALSDIIGGVVSCTLELSGSVNPDEACAGTVRLDGEELPCDDPNGWRAVDSTHIELTGTACERLMDGAERVTATFPCDVILI